MSNRDIKDYRDFALRNGLSVHELEQYIVWKENNRHDFAGFAPLAKIVQLVANMKIRREEYDKTFEEIGTKYVSDMAYPPMLYRFGVNQATLPTDIRMPFLGRLIKRIKWQLKELQFFISLCFCELPLQLARAPVKIPSGRYDEILKVERTQQDLVNEKAIELSGLPRYTAYAKVLFEKDGKQTVWTGKIQTNPLPPPKEGMEAQAVENGHQLSRTRFEIETQIKKRQEKWRVVAPQTPTTPPHEPPPPTRF